MYCTYAGGTKWGKRGVRNSSACAREGSSWLWSNGSWIYNYLCNQCISPLTLWVRIPLMERCTRYNIMWYKNSVTCGRSVVSSTNKTNRHDITEILLEVSLNTITLTLHYLFCLSLVAYFVLYILLWLCPLETFQVPRPTYMSKVRSRTWNFQIVIIMYSLLSKSIMSGCVVENSR